MAGRLRSNSRQPGPTFWFTLHTIGPAQRKPRRSRRKYGVETRIVLADFTDDSAIEPFANAAWNWRGHVDIWVNNAGADMLTGAMAKATYEEKLARLWQIDVLATVRLSRLIGRRMIERGSGTIINIGWDQAATGMDGDSGELFATIEGRGHEFHA